MSNSTRFTNSPNIICWRLTYKCNRACDFCLSKSSPSRKLKTIPFEAIIERIKELGFRKISYSGGEPFIVPEFEKIVEYAHLNDFIQLVTTNGDYLFNNDLSILKYFQYIKLSFYGGEQFHDKIMGEGHFDKLILLIKKFNQSSINVGINYMLSQESILEIEDFLIFVRKFQIFNFLIQRYIPTEITKIDKKYEIIDDPLQDLSKLSTYANYFEHGIKYFNYQNGQGFQVVLDENLDLFFPNTFGCIEYKFGNIFNETQDDGNGNIVNLRTMIANAVDNRINSNTIYTF